MTASVAVVEEPSVDNLDFSEIVEIAGAPGEIRTHDLCLRRAALYPAELRVPINGGAQAPDAIRYRLRAADARRYVLTLPRLAFAAIC